MKKALKEIRVITHPNGYSLSYDGNDFMYFNEVDLLAGFMARVGACKTEEMEKSDILNAVFDVMLGQRYAKDITKLNDTVLRLEAKYSDKINKLEKQIALFNEANEVYEDMTKKSKNLIEAVHVLMEGYTDACKPYDEFRARLDKLEKATEKMESHFKTATSKSEVMLKDIELSFDNIKKTESYLSSQSDMLLFKLRKMTEIENIEENHDDTDDESIAVEVPAGKKTNDNKENKTKHNTSRKKRDEEILTKINENPNII